MGYEQNRDKQVIVVGAGAGGMMAAAAAAAAGSPVVLLEKKDCPGLKLALAGGGRCNFTNLSPVDWLVEQVPGNGKFLFSAFRRFTGEDCRVFFTRLGLGSKVEAGGRVFTREGGKVLVQRFTAHLQSLGVDLRLGVEVQSLLLSQGQCVGVVAGGRKWYGKVVVATGGLSYPGTGSTGQGYALAAAAGHRITPCFPSGVGLVCREPWIKAHQLSGLSWPQARLRLFAGSKTLAQEEGECLFTHFGLSGPAVLRLSRAAGAWFAGLYAVGRAEEKGGQGQENIPAPLALSLDLFPLWQEQALTEQLVALGGKTPAKARRTVLRALLPQRLVPVVLQLSQLFGEGKARETTLAQWRNIAGICKSIPLTVTGTKSLREAVVTAGGVAVQEVEPRTMESRLVSGLYFAGEVLDVDAYTGGYNLHLAFATGYVAGEAAAGAFPRG